MTSSERNDTQAAAKRIPSVFNRPLASVAQAPEHRTDHFAVDAIENEAPLRPAGPIEIGKRGRRQCFSLRAAAGRLEC